MNALDIQVCVYFIWVLNVVVDQVSSTLNMKTAYIIFVHSIVEAQVMLEILWPDTRNEEVTIIQWAILVIDGVEVEMV